MKKIVLVGGGGHCRACIDVIELGAVYRITGIIDVPEKVGKNVFGYPVIGTDDDLVAAAHQSRNFLITVGQIKCSSLRKKLFEKVCLSGGLLPVICSSRAYVSSRACIGPGTIIMHDAVVNAGAVIGANCIINTKALIEHDVVVGAHCHIATGARINGGVRIEDEVFVGSGAVCRENILLQKGTVVSGNSFVRS